MSETVVLNTPQQIDMFVFATRCRALGLEIKGMKRRGQSAYSICKEVYGLKGSKQKVYDQMIKMRDEYLGKIVPKDEASDV